MEITQININGTIYDIKDATAPDEARVLELIQQELGVIENGTY